MSDQKRWKKTIMQIQSSNMTTNKSKLKLHCMQTLILNITHANKKKSQTTIPLCDQPFLPFQAKRTMPHAIQTLTAMAQKAGA